MNTALQPPPVPNILIVDDTPANLQLLSGMLHDKGYKPRPVPSGELALGAAEVAAPDLVLLDLGMPGMDGYETCRRLKQLPGQAEVPVIFITAHTEVAEKVRGFEAGAVDYITKPFSLEEVAVRIRTHLELSQLRREQAHQVEKLAAAVAQRTAELAAAKERLALLDRAKSDFLSLISHELRTPLNGILGVTELILGSVNGPALAAYEGMYEASRRSLMTLIDDALLLTQIGSNADDGVREQSDLGPLLDVARGQAMGLAVSRQVRLGAVPAGLRPVTGSTEYLTRAMQSLLETAVKLAQGGSTVRLATTPDPDEVGLSIETEGREVPVEALPGFFDLLAQARSIAPGGDLGLGPALAERIVSLYGGQVSVENVRGVGVRLLVQFKAADPGTK